MEFWAAIFVSHGEHTGKKIQPHVYVGSFFYEWYILRTRNKLYVSVVVIPEGKMV